MKKKNAGIIAIAVVLCAAWYVVCYFAGKLAGYGIGKFILKNWEE